MPWEKQFDPDEVLDRAMHVFWEQGYGATSMQDLVDGTGINRASLYATYTDKRALFLAALRRYDETTRRRLIGDDEAQAPRDAIRAVFMAFAEQAREGGECRGCFLTNTALELAARDPEVRAIVAHAQEQLEAFFVRMIRRGQAQGQFSRDVRPAEAARGLLASLLGLVVLVRSRPERPLLEGIVRDALRRLD